MLNPVQMQKLRLIIRDEIIYPEQEGESQVRILLLISSNWEDLEKERKPRKKKSKLQRRRGDSLSIRKVCFYCLTSEMSP